VGGLSKSGKELIKLLRRADGQSESDDDDQEDTNVVNTTPLKLVYDLKFMSCRCTRSFVDLLSCLLLFSRKMSRHLQYLLQN
jgi:hypothetical protein